MVSTVSNESSHENHPSTGAPRLRLVHGLRPLRSAVVLPQGADGIQGVRSFGHQDLRPCMSFDGKEICFL